MENSNNKNQKIMVETASTTTISKDRNVIEMGQASTLTLGSSIGRREEMYRGQGYYF